MPAESINGDFCSARSFARDSQTPQACGKGSATMAKCLVADYLGDFFKSRTDKTVSNRVDRQFIKAAGYLPSVEQLMPFCVQNVDSAAKLKTRDADRFCRGATREDSSRARYQQKPVSAPGFILSFFYLPCFAPACDGYSFTRIGFISAIKQRALFRAIARKRTPIF